VSRSLPKTRLQLISEWRRAVHNLAGIVKSLVPGSEVYLFGGAAEGRLTALSDIDVLVVVNKEEVSPEERVMLLARIWERLESIQGLSPGKASWRVMAGASREGL